MRFIHKKTCMLLLALLTPPVNAGGEPSASVESAADCAPIHGVEFICGPRNVEDMVQLPDSPWIIGAGTGWDIYAINAQSKDWFPMEITHIQHSDSPEFTGCPAQRPAEGNVNHGIGLRVNPDRADELYVVNHTTRESVEVFDVVLSDDGPALHWKGCMVMPGKAFGNSVAPLPEGGIAVTITVEVSNPDAMADFVAGRVSGYVLEWYPDTGWRYMEGSEIPGNNGIEITSDGKRMYVGGYGDGTVVRFSLDDDGAILAKDQVKIPFDRADNIRWSPSGTLLVTGHNGTIEESSACTVSNDTICGQDYGFLEMDPESLEILKVVHKKGTPEFGSATTTLQVDDEYWVGTFRGDRVGRIPVE